MLPYLLLTLAIFLIVLAALRIRRVRFLDVNPQYRQYLEGHGLNQVEDFLTLPAVIVSGHLNRNVAQVSIGEGTTSLRGYLKREHWIYWRDYVTNAWAGFGWVSRSYREALMLQELRRAGVRCPEVIASGQDGRGRAFLLVREIEGATELRAFLQQMQSASAEQRRALARHLGAVVARVHAAGYIHGDLNATHVMVDEESAMHLLDWQRSRRWAWPSWRQRLHDLAGIDATLAEELAGVRDRLTCLRSYLREGMRLGQRRRSLSLRTAAVLVARCSRRLLQKRHVRELRQPPLAAGTQNLVWLDGEALCVTSEFHERLHRQTPDWLRASTSTHDKAVTWERVEVPGSRGALLVRRRVYRPWRWLWSLLRGTPITSPEVRQAATLFRLQRYGVEVPRLLAMGQRHLRPWETDSFLLTETPAARVGLGRWLERAAKEACLNGDHQNVRHVLVSAGQVLRRLHDANFYLDAQHATLLVTSSPSGLSRVVVGNVGELHMRRWPSERRAQHDLLALARHFAERGVRRTEVLRFVRAYASDADRRRVRGVMRKIIEAANPRRASSAAK